MVKLIERPSAWNMYRLPDLTMLETSLAPRKIAATSNRFISHPFWGTQILELQGHQTLIKPHNNDTIA